MKVTIWGSRGSLPAPLTPLQVEQKIIRAIQQMPEIDTSDEKAVRAYVRGLDALSRGTAGGNTTCVQVEAGGVTIAIDAGTGIRELGYALMKGPFGHGKGELHLLFSHPHWDHIQGLPFFMPAFVPGNRITIYSVHDLRKALVEQQRPLNFPVPMSIMDADITFVRLQEGQPFTIGGLQINTIRNAHPGDSYAYRIEDAHSTFVFASDSEYKQLDDAGMQPHIEFFRNASALIFDAQYTLGEGWVKEDWGHSSAMIGVEMALAAGVEQLILFHHDPTNEDLVLQRILADAQAYRDELGGKDVLQISIAYEGLVVDLTPTGTVGTAIVNGESLPILVPTRVFDEQSVLQMAEKLVVLDEQGAGGKGRIIDLSQVETLTTASLKQLVKLQQSQGQTPLVLAAPSPSAQRVIELGGLSEFFAIYPTVQAAQTAVAARASAQLPGHILGNRFLIERMLAAGSMGSFLLATDQQTSDKVTVRIIAPAYSAETRKRVFDQSDTLLAAKHPNLLSIIALAVEEEIAYIAEAYSPGKTLDKVVRAYPQGMPVKKAIEIALAIADGIHYAHSLGIVHGNLKADKIYIHEGHVQIGGLALGRLDEGLDLREVPIIRQEVAYLAPEQITGRPIDARTDLYALGVIFFLLFTGRHPFQGNEEAVLQAHLDQDPPSPAAYNPALQSSPSLTHLILKLLSKSPAHRYNSAAQARRILLAMDAHSSGVLEGEPGYLSPYLGDEDAVYVGRENELRLLRELWDRAKAGAGQLVFISGEQGVGKTKLAEEVAKLSQAPVVLFGRGLERRGSRAFSPFAEALLTYLRTVPPELFDPRARQLISEFASVIPDAQDLLPGLEQPEPLDPPQEQLRRMNSITRFIARATANRPWILILDDLQWADDSSLALLRYLSFDLPNMPLLIFAAHREMAPSQSHPLNDLLASLSGHESVTHIELDRFDKFDLVELIINEWDSQIPRELLETIFEHTGGNPLFIREVIQSLVAENMVTFEDGAWHYPAPDAVQLPPSLQDVVRQRIGALSVTTRTLLQQAAVLGQEFQLDVLRHMSDLPEWPLLEHLDVALQEGFIREAAGEGIFRFQHHDIRRALYEMIPAVRRRLWHKIAGETLERLTRSDRQAAPPFGYKAEVLAIHFIEADLPQKAILYSHEAAKLAQAAYNNDTAVDWYGLVLKLLNDLEPQERAHFAALQTAATLNLGKVLELVGKWDQARAQFEEAIQLAQGAGDRPAVAWGQIASGELYSKQGAYEQALACFRRAEEEMKTTGDREGLAQVLHYKGNVATLQADLDTAQAYYLESLALRREMNNQPGIAHMLNNLAVLAEYRGQFAESLTLHQQALALRRQDGDRRMIALSLNNLADVLLKQEDYEAARANLEEALTLYREIGDRWLLAQSLSNLGSVARETGALDEARRLFAESSTILLEVHDPWAKANLLVEVARLVFREGDARTAVRLVRTAVALRGSIDAPLPPREQAALEAFMGELQAALGGEGMDQIEMETVLEADEALRLALQFMAGETHPT